MTLAALGPVCCKRCGRAFRPVRTGKIRAHLCPHDVQCRPPKKTRTRGEHCEACFAERQTTIFDVLERASRRNE
jgi:hypothetical protein